MSFISILLAIPKNAYLLILRRISLLDRVIYSNPVQFLKALSEISLVLLSRSMLKRFLHSAKAFLPIFPFIVIPLTSNQSGLGINKVELEITSQLPKNLQSKKTYAVYDQIRTVNASRFHPLLENGTLCEVKVSSEELDIIVTAIIQNLLQGMPTEQVTSILKACSSIEK